MSLYMIRNVQYQIQHGNWKPEAGEMEKLNQRLLQFEETKEMEEEPPFKMDFGSQDIEEDSEYQEEINPDMQELYDEKEPDFRERVEERDGRKLPGKMVQGELLEHFVSTQARDMDIGERDGNEFLMNIPGIDHIHDKKSHMFVQDKLHLSQHTAKIETYRAHYAKRYVMAQKLLKTMASDGKRGDSIRGMFEDIIGDDTWIHKDEIQTILKAVNTHREAYTKAMGDDSNDSLPNILDDDTLIEFVGDNFAFSVPKDIWEELYKAYEKGDIPEDEMNAYIRLDLDTNEFRQLFEMMDHVAAPWSERDPKRDDEEYTE